MALGFMANSNTVPKATIRFSPRIAPFLHKNSTHCQYKIHTRKSHPTLRVVCLGVINNEKDIKFFLSHSKAIQKEKYWSIPTVYGQENGIDLYFSEIVIELN